MNTQAGRILSVAVVRQISTPPGYCEPGRSYVAGTFGFDTDPFTCEPSPFGSALCFDTGEQLGCSLTASSVFTPNGTVDVAIDIDVARANAVTVRGRNAAGQRFECTGMASNNPLAGSAWSCQTCAGPTPSECRTCAVSQIGACNL